LQKFCANNLGELKKTLINKTSAHKKRINIPKTSTAKDIKNKIIKDLIFVMSEIAQHLPKGDWHNQGKATHKSNPL
jgi:hypothetical protein